MFCLLTDAVATCPAVTGASNCVTVVASTDFTQQTCPGVWVGGDTLFPALSIDDSMVLSSAVVLLLAGTWVWKQLRNAA